MLLLEYYSSMGELILIFKILVLLNYEYGRQERWCFLCCFTQKCKVIWPLFIIQINQIINSISSPVPVTPEFHEKHAHAYSVNLHVAFSVDRHRFLFSIAKLDFIFKNKR